MKSLKLILTLSLICFVLCCFCPGAHAETNITFTWNQTMVPDLAGFNLYQREDPNGQYTPVARISDPNAREYTLENVPDNKNLYWVLRAFDNDSLESASTNEVNQNLTGPPPVPGSFHIKVIVDVTVNQ